jgi:hypothetical protein
MKHELRVMLPQVKREHRQCLVGFMEASALPEHPFMWPANLRWKG